MRFTHLTYRLTELPARALIIIIAWYQRLFSPDTGFLTAIFGRRRPTCAFYPTCSVYTQQALVKYGFFKGLALGIRRILRCHPWQKDHFNPLT